MNGHAVCPFCENPVMNAGIEFSDSLLHEGCYVELQEGMDGDPVVSLPGLLTLQESTENVSEAA